MTRVVAAIDNSTAARPVLSAASEVARLYGATAEAVHVREDGARTAQAIAAGARLSFREVDGPVLTALVHEAQRPDVAVLVLGARSTHAGRRPAGHVALALAQAATVPLLVVPPEATVPVRLEHVLVPLDGTDVAADTLAATVRLACRAELDVIVLHVHEHGSLPLFSDQLQHEVDAWEDEFLRRHCPHPDLVRLETRVGAPGRHVLQVAVESGVDLIALGWAQQLDPGRAAVVREALAGATIPVLLVPVPADADAPRDGGAAAAHSAGARGRPSAR